jgi:hypothetical protein
MAVFVTLISDESNSNQDFLVTEFIDGTLQNQPKIVNKNQKNISHWKVLNNGSVKYSKLIAVPFKSAIHHDVEFLFVARMVKTPIVDHNQPTGRSIKSETIIQSVILRNNSGKWEISSVLSNLNVGETVPEDNANFQLAFDGKNIWLLFRKLISHELYFVDPNTKHNHYYWYPARIPSDTEIEHVEIHLQSDGLLFTGSGKMFIDLAESEFNFDNDIVGPYFIEKGDKSNPVTMLNDPAVVSKESSNIIKHSTQDFLTTFNPISKEIGTNQVSFVSGHTYNLYSAKTALTTIYGTNTLTKQQEPLKYDHSVHCSSDEYTCHKVKFFNRYSRVKIPNPFRLTTNIFIHSGIRLAKKEYCIFSFPVGSISVHHIKNGVILAPAYTGEPDDPSLIIFFRKQSMICDIRKGGNNEVLLLTKTKNPCDVNDGMLTQWKLEFQSELLKLSKLNEMRMFQMSSKDAFLLHHGNSDETPGICLLSYNENLPGLLPCVTCSCCGDDARKNRQNNLFVGAAGHNFFPMYNTGKETEIKNMNSQWTIVYG